MRTLRALDRDELVVVKVLHEQFASASHYRETFRRELDLLSRFRHPGAVELYEAALCDRHGPCLIMEYVPGEPLDELLRRHGRLDPMRVGRLLGQLCGVLQAAHTQGIIHRDLKPANILAVEADTPNERIKVLDFGLARLTVASPQGLYIPLDKFTGARANAAVGTPEYTCPEALRGDPVDHRADLYGVGVILYQLLTGQLPFNGPTVRDLLSAHVHQPPPPFVRWIGKEGIPTRVEGVVQACLAKDPADRPQSARELAQRYGEAVGQEVWVEQETAQPMSPASVPVPAPVAEVVDPHAEVYHLEAWMPEQIAAVKLRGFLDAASGEVIESVPGLIRVRLPWRKVARPQASSQGFWSRLGFGNQTGPMVEIEWAEMDVRLEKSATDGSSRLLLTVRLRPAEGAVRETVEWRAWCESLHGNLKAYVMSR